MARIVSTPTLKMASGDKSGIGVKPRFKLSSTNPTRGRPLATVDSPYFLKSSSFRYPITIVNPRWPHITHRTARVPTSSMYHTNSSSYVLVTGATGFIGAHVVDNLLSKGLKVRGSTRSARKGEEMKAARPQYTSQLDFVVVEDFTKIGVFDAVMEGIDSVIHVASVSESSPQILIQT